MTILLTGSSRGIGEELAYQLAEDGHQLILISRSREILEKVADTCNSIAGMPVANALVCDLKDLCNVHHDLDNQLKALTTKIDVVVNNAGMLYRKPFQSISPGEEIELFKANYFGPAELIRTCVTYLRNSEQPSVVNITSMAAFPGSSKFPGMSSYSSSKGALATLTECLAEELKDENIRVNALAFGAVQTKMLGEAFPGFTAKTTPAEMASFTKWFLLEGCHRFNGKILPVSDSTP